MGKTSMSPNNDVQSGFFGSSGIKIQNMKKAIVNKEIKDI